LPALARHSPSVSEPRLLHVRSAPALLWTRDADSLRTLRVLLFALLPDGVNRLDKRQYANCTILHAVVKPRKASVAARRTCRYAANAIRSRRYSMLRPVSSGVDGRVTVSP
jgi:hypothetical protein